MKIAQIYEGRAASMRRAPLACIRGSERGPASGYRVFMGQSGSVSDESTGRK